MKTPKFPKDNDGQFLRDLFVSGIDFSKLRKLDFYIVVPNEKRGEELHKLLIKKGINNKFRYDDNDEEWRCSLTIEMKLSYEGIAEVKDKLRKLCEPLGGYIDGLGIRRNE